MTELIILTHLGPTKVFLQHFLALLLLFSCWVMFGLSVTLWTIAHQAPLSVGFFRRECKSWLPFPSPEDLLTQGSNLHLLHWQADSLLLSHPRSPKRGTLRETNRRGRTGEMLPFVTVNCEPVIRSALTYSFWKGLHNLAIEFPDSHLL